MLQMVSGQRCKRRWFCSRHQLVGRITGTIPYLVLPTICYTYAQLAFLSRMTRVSTLEIYGQDFIRTARKGSFSTDSALLTCLFNALLPIITVFANVFPAAIGGSVILETVFSIPGMGRDRAGYISAGLSGHCGCVHADRCADF